jgi:membrane protease subunit HflC
MNKLFSLGLLTFIGLILFASCVFVVDQRQHALVLAFGEIRREVKEPGLHFKAPPPFNSVLYFDNRLLTIDTPQVDRARTSENVELLVDSFVKWRISDIRQFYRTFGARGEAAARDRLNDLIRDAVQNSFRRRTVNDVTSKQRDIVRQEITKAVLDGAKNQNFGIEVVDVRLKRIEFSEDILSRVYVRMASDRKSVANERRSSGQAEGERIRAEADKERAIIIAEAYRDAQKMKGEGDARASQIYASAFGQNAEFAAFYRSLEAYRATFAQKQGNMMVLDPSSEFFRYMRQPAAPARR